MGFDMGLLKNVDHRLPSEGFIDRRETSHVSLVLCSSRREKEKGRVWRLMPEERVLHEDTKTRGGCVHEMCT